MIKTYLLSAKKLAGAALMAGICCFSTSHAQQSRNFLWANSGGNMFGANCSAVTAGAGGNVFAAGTYKWTIDFGGIHLDAPDSNAADFLQNGWVAKYDANGNVKWAVAITGDNTTYVTSIAADASSNVYVAGYFNSHTLTVDKTHGVTNSKYGKHDIFIVKYDKDGVVQWVKSWGGSDNDQLNSMRIDGNGNLYVAGQFYSATLNMGSIPLLNVNTDLSHITSDLFVARIEPAGNVIWAYSYGGTEPEAANAIAVNDSNVYVAGYFRSTALTMGTTTLNLDSTTTTEDIFVAKFDVSGSLSWAVRAGGGLVDVPTTMTTDGNGNIYIAGTTTSGLFKIGSMQFAGKGSNDMFVAKMDASGNFTWAATAGGESIDQASAIAADGSGNVFVSGYFNSTVTNFGSTQLYSAGNYDFFVAKYTSSGSLAWVKNDGGDGIEKINSMSMDGSGYLYFGGTYSSDVMGFNSPPKVYSDGVTNDMFVAKMDNKEAAGIKDGYVTGLFTLYPNPSNGLVHISCAATRGQNSVINVCNAFGQKVFSKTVSSLNNQDIDLSGFATGVYTISVNNGQATESQRIVKY